MSPTTLFTLPIPSTGGTITCTNPPPLPPSPTSKRELDVKKIYILTFISPPDNRLTPIFIKTFLLALDILEHRYPKGVVITTSGIGKFYSNGLDLELAMATEGFFERDLWGLFRRLITYPMPTIALLNGHAFAGGLMLAMYHDYRVMNPTRGYLCLNEIEFGVPLQTPMMSIFKEKLPATALRDLVLEAKRVGGNDALSIGLVDAVGGVKEVLEFVGGRGLEGKAQSGIYGVMKEEMYRGVLGGIDGHKGNLEWREGVEERKGVLDGEARERVEGWERERENGKAKL
ncbi:enoyl-CoA hydratase/isomerase family protein [Aspergillus karnatakaensis]|uniref:enoyl-CoA hydratase/isomerase family protein n=1 Tax=Aspergillus karnatakaensis TaxID=1810916 RepID=UPI003CCDE2DE